MLIYPERPERPEMNIRRMKRLILILRTVQKREEALRAAGIEAHKFDMGTWAVRGMHKTVGLSEHLCETRACALGWAATDPQFRRAGLRLYFADGSPSGTVVYQPKKDGPRYASFLAAQEFFGLTYNEATRVFTASEPDNNIPAVIRTIERVIADYEARKK